MKGQHFLHVHQQTLHLHVKHQTSFPPLFVAVALVAQSTWHKEYSAVVAHAVDVMLLIFLYAQVTLQDGVVHGYSTVVVR